MPLTLTLLFLISVVCVETTFFEDKFGAESFSAGSDYSRFNDPKLHMIIYLQVAMISQALIFVTRSHGWSWMERPSFALMGAFCVAQLISSIIAGYGDWGFTKVEAISGTYIGIVWVWVSLNNLSWYRGTCHFDRSVADRPLPSLPSLPSQNIVWYLPLDVGPSFTL